MAEPVWEMKFRGESVSLTLEDLTVHRVRELKSFFGDDYGIPQKFLALLFMGEVDALTGVLWINGQKTGKPIGDPLTFEWNVGEFDQPDKPKRVARPGKGQSSKGTSGKTPSSETPTSSADGT